MSNPQATSEPAYLTRAEAADYLRTSIRSLSRMKCPCYHVAGKTLYKRADLDAWMERRKQVSDLDLLIIKLLGDLKRKPKRHGGLQS